VVPSARLNLNFGNHDADESAVFLLNEVLYYSAMLADKNSNSY
jgi:hypothetical protein